MPPLSVYVHVPWCVRKCPYCDFNSHASRVEDIPEAAFVSRIQEDIAQDAPLAQNRLLSSVFFGGGTPSLLSASAIDTILTQLDNAIGLASDAEITLEANPGTFESQKFAGYRSAGVNRLSIGVQSFQDSFLSALGRIHSSEEAVSAIEQAKRVGFTNFNIDLMHGLPDQDESKALADLNQAIALEPTHISWYQLTIEQNTEFYSAPPVLPEDEALWSIQNAGQVALANSGFEQYEVSAFAQKGRQSQHNLNYWRYGDYLGIGPGAHGKTSRLGSSIDITRTRKTRLPKDYLNLERPLVRIEEPVAPIDRPFDYFINTLRLREPVSLNHFQGATGVTLADITPTLTMLETRGWIQWNGDLFTTTETGFLYLNEVLAYWLPES